jgi:hypothetical protein
MGLGKIKAFRPRARSMSLKPEMILHVAPAGHAPGACNPKVRRNAAGARFLRCRKRELLLPFFA